jgi:hypothetical protein
MVIYLETYNGRRSAPAVTAKARLAVVRGPAAGAARRPAAVISHAASPAPQLRAPDLHALYAEATLI